MIALSKGGHLPTSPINGAGSSFFLSYIKHCIIWRTDGKDCSLFG